MRSPKPTIHVAKVPPSLDGERLDKAIAALFASNLSRGLARKLLEVGAVRVDGHRVRAASRPVRPGQRIEVGLDTSALERSQQSIQEPRPLTVVAELPGALVVAKPAGQHTQATAFGAAGTLEDDVARWLKDNNPRLPARLRPFVGIVHRLDAEASGLLVVATRRETAAELTLALRERHVVRIYDALVEGQPIDPAGRIELPLTKRVSGRVRVAAPGQGAPATTRYQLLAAVPSLGWSHLRLALETGRQHQIRVHLAETFGPIVGDTLYGTGNHPGRLRLHARRLAFRLGPKGPKYRFESPPDAAFFSLPGE